MNTFNEFEFVQHKYFYVGKMLVVKILPSDYYGVRYLADSNVLIYGEYHKDELEMFIDPNKSKPDVLWL